MVFTDADAKDDDRQGEVTAAALAKYIKITIFRTGTCSGRKRRDTPGMNFKRLFIEINAKKLKV
jgi:hypothetical protein